MKFKSNKIKRKRLRLTLKKFGGYYLSSINPEHFLGQIITRVEPFLDNLNNANTIGIDNTLDFMINSPYTEIIPYLLNNYYSNKTYDETFINENRNSSISW